MAGTFELKRSSNGQFYFNLKAGNGEVILTSEMYIARSSAVNGIASVKKNSPNDGRYERKSSTNGKPFFVLKAGNNQVIGQSEMYESEQARDAGILSVKNGAPEAATIDHTAKSQAAGS
jgi:uncharacterized protein